MISGNTPNMTPKGSDPKNIHTNIKRIEKLGFASFRIKAKPGQILNKQNYPIDDQFKTKEYTNYNDFGVSAMAGYRGFVKDNQLYLVRLRLLLKEYPPDENNKLPPALTPILAQEGTLSCVILKTTFDDEQGYEVVFGKNISTGEHPGLISSRILTSEDEESVLGAGMIAVTAESTALLWTDNTGSLNKITRRKQIDQACVFKLAFNTIAVKQLGDLFFDYSAEFDAQKKEYCEKCGITSDADLSKKDKDEITAIVDGNLEKAIKTRREEYKKLRENSLNNEETKGFNEEEPTSLTPLINMKMKIKIGDMQKLDELKARMESVQQGASFPKNNKHKLNVIEVKKSDVNNKNQEGLVEEPSSKKIKRPFSLFNSSSSSSLSSTSIGSPSSKKRGRSPTEQSPENSPNLKNNRPNFPEKN